MVRSVPPATARSHRSRRPPTNACHPSLTASTLDHSSPKQRSTASIRFFMRFQVLEDSWILDVLTPTEWELLSELPNIASGDSFSRETRDRLFPSPISPETLVDEEVADQVEDWDEFVRPDIQESFTNDRDRVRADLGRAEIIDPSEFLSPEQIEEWDAGFPDLRRLPIPIPHTEAWYSSLNQARILLNEEHDLADSEERLALHEDEIGDAVEQLDPERVMLLARYELFSAIQVLLVEKVMQP